MKPSKIDLLLTLMVVVISGDTALGYFDKEPVLIVPFVVLALVAVYRKVTVPVRVMVIPLIFAFIYAVHWAEFGGITLASSGGMLLRIGTALLAVRTVPDFGERYIRVMYGLSLLSLAFFLPGLFGVDMEGIFRPFIIPLDDGELHIGIHNFTRDYEDDLYRNPGLFWEPGAFAVYLTLALALCARNIQSRAMKYPIVLAVALLSTQSTTGYIAFAAVLLMLMWTYFAKAAEALGKLLLVILAAVFLVGAYVAYSSIDFLSEKISNQFEASEGGKNGYQLTRYGNLLYDLEFIRERPVFGWSSVGETRLVDTADEDAQGNGLSGYWLKYGLVGVLCFFTFAYLSLTSYYRSRRLAIACLAIVALLLVGEQFLNFPMFLTLMFLGLLDGGRQAQNLPERWLAPFARG